MSRVEGVQVRREPANDRQSLRMPVGIGRWRQRRPPDRKLGRDRLLAAIFEPHEEQAEQLLGSRELVTKRAAHRQVPSEMLLEHGHDRASGHGRAS
jgi:hypothetical protein